MSSAAAHPIVRRRTRPSRQASRATCVSSGTISALGGTRVHTPRSTPSGPRTIQRRKRWSRFAAPAPSGTGRRWSSPRVFPSARSTARHVDVPQLPDERPERGVQVARRGLVRGDEAGLERAPRLEHPPHPEEQHRHVGADVEAVDEAREQRPRPRDVEPADEGRRRPAHRREKPLDPGQKQVRPAIGQRGRQERRDLHVARVPVAVRQRHRVQRHPAPRRRGPLEPVQRPAQAHGPLGRQPVGAARSHGTSGSARARRGRARGG